MRVLAMLLSLLCVSCASSSGGATVDASEGGVPFALARSGLVEEVDLHHAFSRTPVKLRFVFTNVTHRDYTVEKLEVRHSSRGTRRLHFDPAFVTVRRMVDAGDDLALDVVIYLGPGERYSGERRDAPLGVDAFLTTSDGTRYRYSVGIPIQ